MSMTTNVTTYNATTNVTTYNATTNVHPEANFKLTNTQARLITLNVTDDMTGEKSAFQILPGHNDATPVPASAIESDFAKHLIASGQLIVQSI